MIKSFRDRDTENIFARKRVKRYSLVIQKLAQRKLNLIDGADRIEDLRVPPGNRLEKLSGNRKGQYSIRINNQWRICFHWQTGQASNVEIVDYH
ncbi:MAG: type II toxin-antitoxin system RelE/ParE family toxin [Rhodothermales bacterium]